MGTGCPFPPPLDKCMRGSRGGRGSGPPWKIKTNIGFLSNTCPNPLKKHQAINQAFKLGHHRHAGETPYKWRFAGEPMMATLIVVFIKKLSNFGPLWQHFLDPRMYWFIQPIFWMINMQSYNKRQLLIASVALDKYLRRSRGGTEGPDPHPPPPKKNKKNTEIKGFLAILVRIPWKSTNPAFKIGQSSARQRNAIMAFRWRDDDGPAHSGIWILPLLIK